MTGGRPLVAIVRFPGSLDHDSARRAVEGAGGEARYAWHTDSELPEGTRGVVLPGGFSYGDHLRCGAIASRSPVMAAVRRHADAGGAVLGICNGFQVLCEAGLLPGALLPNAGLRFVCRQVDLVVENRHTPFTRACEEGERLSVPVKHTTGRYYAPEAALDELEAEGQVIFRYAEGQNPNGAARDIAGITNRHKNVAGLMPHPEHAVDPLTGSADGGRLFESLVAHIGALAPA